MAHRTLISGTGYGIKGGRTLIGGTGYGITKGRTLVGGTGYNVSFIVPPLIIYEAGTAGLQNGSVIWKSHADTFCNVMDTYMLIGLSNWQYYPTRVSLGVYNFSNYKTLKLTGYPGSDPNAYTRAADFWMGCSSSSSADASGVDTKIAIPSNNNMSATVSLDITGISGNKYILINVYMKDGTSYRITKLWLE